MKAPQHPEMVSISKKIEEPVEVVHHAEKQDVPPAINKIAIQNKRNVDQLYLVKWRGLSYN
jgi:hypothetical protein